MYYSSVVPATQCTFLSREEVLCPRENTCRHPTVLFHQNYRGKIPPVLSFLCIAEVKPPVRDAGAHILPRRDRPLQYATFPFLTRRDWPGCTHLFLRMRLFFCCLRCFPSLAVMIDGYQHHTVFKKRILLQRPPLRVTSQCDHRLLNERSYFAATNLERLSRVVAPIRRSFPEIALLSYEHAPSCTSTVLPNSLSMMDG